MMHRLICVYMAIALTATIMILAHGSPGARADACLDATNRDPHVVLRDINALRHPEKHNAILQRALQRGDIVTVTCYLGIWRGIDDPLWDELYVRATDLTPGRCYG